MTDEDFMDNLGIEYRDVAFEIEASADETKRMSFDPPSIWSSTVTLSDEPLRWSEMGRAEALNMARLKARLGDAFEAPRYMISLVLQLEDKKEGRELARDFLVRLAEAGLEGMVRHLKTSPELGVPELWETLPTADAHLRLMGTDGLYSLTDGSRLTTKDEGEFCEMERRVHSLSCAIESQCGVVKAALQCLIPMWKSHSTRYEWALRGDNILMHLHACLPADSPVLRAIWTHPDFPSRHFWENVVHFPGDARQDVLTHLEKHHAADIKNDRALFDRVLSEAVRYGQLATAWRIAKMVDGAAQKYWIDRIMKVVRE